MYFFLVLSLIWTIVSANISELSPSKEVFVFTAEWCDIYCDRWLEWISRLENTHPSIVFHRLDIDKDVEQAKRFNLTNGIYSNYKDHYLEVPTCVWVEGSEIHLFNGARTFPGLSKWVHNALEGQYHPIFSTSNLQRLGLWDSKQEASITVLSDKEPTFSPLLAEIPSLGYSWGVVNTPGHPVIFIKSMTNNISMAFDYRWDSVFKKILPPIIPIWLATSPIGLESIRYFGMREVEIHYDGTLDNWWNDLSLDFPYTTFLHFRANESTPQYMSKVMLRSRSVIYQYNSVKRVADEWFRNIWKGNITPKYRQSTEPHECHPQFVDITGDTLWPWLKQHDMLMYTYNKHSSGCEAMFQSLYGLNNSIVLARMNFDENDHEIFPNVAKTDYMYLFKNMTLVKVLNCKESPNISSLFH